MPFLLDTNVVSETRKATCDPHVRRWLASQQPSDLYLSVLVLGEVRQGIERLRRRDVPQATVLERWLETLVESFSGRVLPVTTAVADEWGRMNARDPVSPVDGLMAATAIVHNLTIVTRNTSDFKAASVKLLNPFLPPDEQKP